MLFASISARRRNADPLPYLAPVDPGQGDGIRISRDAAAALDWDAVRYAPRPEYQPAQHLEANPILDAARDTFDGGDPWGWAMGWAFAACAALDALEAPVPAEMGYSAGASGPLGALSDGSYECSEVVSILGLGVLVGGDDGEAPEVCLDDLAALPVAEQHRAIDIATHAARVLSRYLDAAKASGLDY